MTIWENSLLLLLLRRRLEEERTADWQTLHQRDRNWFLDLVGGDADPYRALRLWLTQWDSPRPGSVNLLSIGLSVLSLALGASLMAGLLEFFTFGRINLLWFMLIAVALPLIWWLSALFFSVAQVPLPLKTLFLRLLPQGSYPAVMRPLMQQTLVALGQQLSLLFSLSMVLTFLVYLLVTDLAFGWSSTLDLTAAAIQRVTELLSWPWRYLWPEAVPSLELIEKTHYFRSAPLVAERPQLLGQWWNFLLMCLLVYALLPRLLTTLIQRFRLKRMQQRILARDALISGLWQRMTTGFIDHAAETVDHLHAETGPAEEAGHSVSYPQVVSWGIWPDEIISALGAQLGRDTEAVYWQDMDSPEKAGPIMDGLKEMDDQQLLLLCKGWEPPTGELADICHDLARVRKRVFLWPASLPGMSNDRKAMLMQSWHAFMQQIPDNFHLITADSL